MHLSLSNFSEKLWKQLQKEAPEASSSRTNISARMRGYPDKSVRGKIKLPSSAELNAQACEKLVVIVNTPGRAHKNNPKKDVNPLTAHFRKNIKSSLFKKALNDEP